MRHLSLLALLVPSTVLTAQMTAQMTAQTTSSEPVVVLQVPASQGCPVGLSARHANQGAVMNVSPASAKHGQGYQLSFEPIHEHAIAQARITLHGIAGGQIIPAGIPAGSASAAKLNKGKDITESFTVSPSSDEKHQLFQSTVYTEKLTGVQWVELNEITYTDGSTWHESANAVCRVAPNGFMLVASQR